MAADVGRRRRNAASVVGLDGLPEVRRSAPPLTTVRRPPAGMGTTAVRTALRPARGEQPDPPRVEPATERVVRGEHSTPGALTGGTGPRRCSPLHRRGVPESPRATRYLPPSARLIAKYAGFGRSCSSHGRAAPSPGKNAGIHEYLSV